MATVPPLGIGGFAAMRALSRRNDDPQTASRPGDKDRGGFVLGAQGTDAGWFSAARVRAFGRRPLSEEGAVKGRPTCGIMLPVEPPKTLPRLDVSVRGS